MPNTNTSWIWGIGITAATVDVLVEQSKDTFFGAGLLRVEPLQTCFINEAELTHRA